MSLVPGSRVGASEVVGLVGAGGMGEVYRARDRKLNRDVAIKILPELFARDPERLARFEREAQTSPRSIIRTSPPSTALKATRSSWSSSMASGRKSASRHTSDRRRPCIIRPP